MMNLGAPTTFTYAGFTPYVSFGMEIPEHASAPFWVMFGTPFPADVPCDTITFLNTAASPTARSWAEAYGLGMVESQAPGYDSATQQFFTAGPASFSPNRTAPQPWYGYWLLVNRKEACTVTLPAPRQEERRPGRGVYLDAGTRRRMWSSPGRTFPRPSWLLVET